MSADLGVSRSAVKLPPQATAVVPTRHTVLLGTTVVVPVRTSAAPVVVRPCTVSLNRTVEAPVSVFVAATIAVGEVESTGPPPATVTAKSNSVGPLALPRESAARTNSLCEPGTNAAGGWNGVVQAVNVPASSAQA